MVRSGFLILCLLAGATATADPTDNAETVFDTQSRVLWTTSRIKGSPEPPDPYRLEVAFPHLQFDQPIDLIPVPGINRLAVVEYLKGISTFIADPATENAEVLLEFDAESGVNLFAATFHPEFAQNRWAYYTYFKGDMIYLARVQCSDSSGVPRADVNSSDILYQWPEGGHNGGCIRFGPDGFLYLGTGDGSLHSDTNQYAQDIGDPRGSILRLDVDHADGEKLYSIPPDNPFVDVPGALPEIYAYGLRQPWKFDFDSMGRLWAGEVGQDLWEMVYLIQKGGNYGWSINEGTHPFRPERRRGPTAIVSPIVEHHHRDFRSLTGGHVYAGSRLPELRDGYIYGDFDTGRIWMLRYDGTTVSDHKQLARVQARIVGFGVDHSGEIYAVDYAGGRISQLQRAPATREEQADFPRRLSETGLFAAAAELIPAAGMIPYSINAPPWADGALVERYLGLPGSAQIEFEGLTYPNAPGAPPGWRYPDGTVLVQTFIIPANGTSVGTEQRIETRVLHHQRMPGADDTYGAQVWNGYSYVWNDDQTDAVLADADGLDLALTIHDPQTDQARQMTWHIPSRNECTVCHNISGKHVLGMNTMRMNRNHDYGDAVENQLTVFDRLGLFVEALAESPADLPRLAQYTDERNSRDERARSWLHANCTHCHRQWGGGNSSFQLLATLSLEDLKIVNAAPAHGMFGINDAKLVAPGAPGNSTLLYRMASIGSARMPRLGTSTVDTEGLKLIHDWIADLRDSGLTVPDSSRDYLSQDIVSGSVEQATAAIDQALSSTSRSLQLVWAIDEQEVTESVRALIIERAVAVAEPHVRDLFDRYLPKEQRVRRLGTHINFDAILSMHGDPRAGELLFFRSAVLQCSKCHQINGQGTKLGPDLSRIGKEYDRYRLLDSIVNPSREIKPEYRVYLVQTTDGRVFSGLREPDTGDDVVLRDANNKEVRIAAADVEQLLPQQPSLMPESQVLGMTAQQLADLIAYLNSLR